MKQNKFFLGLATIAATVFAFTSCSQDELSTAKAETPDPGQEILLSTIFSTTRSISQTIQENQIANGVQVGVFVNETNSTTNFVENGNNNYFTADGSGGLTIGNADNKIYYPKTSNVDIYAYAPYQSGWTISDVNTNQNFTVQADQSSDDNYKASDLIWATPKTNQASSESALALAFAHKLSKININIVNNRTGLSLKGATVSILNTVRTATINPSTGATAVKGGESASAITVATYGTESEPTATVESPATASAIIVPQEIAANTKFIQVITSADHNNSESTTLTAKIGTSNKTFASNKSYNYTLTINDNSVELTFNGTSLGSWEDENESGDLEDDTPAVTYTIGDYVLTDGTFVKANAYTSGTVAGIIFSTSVSTTDAAAGYGAYIMGLNRKKMAFPVNTNYDTTSDETKTSTKEYGAQMGTGINNFEDAFADYDGLTKTTTMMGSTYYTSLTTDQQASFMGNLSWHNTTISGSVASSWYLPSFGQLIQILNNLGDADITSSAVTTMDSSNLVELTGVSTSTIASKLQGIVDAVNGTNNMFANGNIQYVCSTENGSNSNSHWGKAWQVKFNTDGNVSVGKNLSRSNDSNYSVIPVAAVKLPTE